MKRKKVEENKGLGEVLFMIKPLLATNILPARMRWQYTDEGLYFGKHGPFPWKCLRALSNMIVDLFERGTNPKVTALSEAYLGIVERAKTGKTKPDDLEMLRMVIKELERL